MNDYRFEKRKVLQDLVYSDKMNASLCIRIKGEMENEQLVISFGKKNEPAGIADFFGVGDADADGASRITARCG